MTVKQVYFKIVVKLIFYPPIMSNIGDLMRRGYMYALFLLTGILIGICSVYAYNILSRNEEKNIIRFAVELNDHSAAFWIALDKGYFKEYGLNIEYKTFSTGLELAVAMARGDIDVALACIGPLLVIRSRGAPIKLVAMTHLNGYAIVVDKNIDSVKDLDGKVVSVSGPGSPAWLLLNLMKDKYGLNIETRKMPPFIAVNALLSNQVEASSLPEHYVTLAYKMGAHVLIRSQDIWSDMPGSGVSVTEDFLYKHRDEVINIIKALAKAIEFIKNNQIEASRIVAKYLATDPGIMEESMKYLNYTIKINVSDIEKYVNYLVRYGAIEKPIDIQTFIDFSIVHEVIDYEK